MELEHAAEDFLTVVAPVLEAAGARRAPALLKLQRVLGERPGIREPTLPASRKAAVSLLVVARLEELRRDLLRRDPAVRLDLPDSVHKMRVAVRRLRTGLATYRPFLDRTVTDPVREELAWLGTLLGEARDAEVLRQHLTDLLLEVAPSAELARVVGSQQAVAYRAAHDRVVVALDSERYRALLDQLEELVAHPQWRPRAEMPVKKAMRRRLRHEWKRLAERITADDPDLHEARKAAKRLRYAIEPLVPAYGKRARRPLEHIKRLQDVLGQHHDCLTAKSRLTELGRQAPAVAFDLGILHAHEEARAQHWARASRKAWRKAESAWTARGGVS